MELFSVNPYFRSADKSGWYWHNREPHISYTHRIFTILAGQASVTFYDPEGYRLSRHLLPAGTSLFYGPGMPYYFNNTNSEPFAYICLEYDLTPAFMDIKCFPGPVPLSEKDPTLLALVTKDSLVAHLAYPTIRQGDGLTQALCEQIWEENFCRRPYFREKCGFLIKEALTEVLRHPPEVQAETVRSAALAAAAIRYMDAHFQENISIKEVAEALHYHPNYLSRVFSQIYGMTPYQYLVHRRVDKAVQLLEHTDLGIGKIALLCGFVNTAHFSAAIRRHTGKKLGEFRLLGK